MWAIIFQYSYCMDQIFVLPASAVPRLEKNSANM